MKTGWEVKTLGEIAEYSIGLTYSPKDVSDEGIIVLRSSNIQEGELDLSDLVRVNKPIKDKLRVREGDILMCSRNGSKRLVGKTATIPSLQEEMTFGTFMTVIRSPYNPFLSWFFISDEFRNQINGGENPMINQVTKYMLDEVEVPIPPLSEQQRIVAILDEAFAAISTAKENAQKNLQNARELFESYLQSVFANPGEGWQEKSLGEVCAEIFAGGDAPKSNFSDTRNEKYTVPIYANSVKDKGLYGFTDFARVTKPSITIAARGSGTGHTELRDDAYFPIVRLIVIIPRMEIMNIKFLKQAIGSFKILRSGSAIPQLTVPMIKEYMVPIPSLEEQQTIVAKLDALSVETKKLEAIYQQKLTDLDELKKSILQKAFQGELSTVQAEALAL